MAPAALNETACDEHHLMTFAKAFTTIAVSLGLFMATVVAVATPVAVPGFLTAVLASVLTAFLITGIPAPTVVKAAAAPMFWPRLYPASPA